VSDPAAAHGRGGGPGSGFDTPPVAGGRVTAHDGAVLWGGPDQRAPWFGVAVPVFGA